MAKYIKFGKKWGKDSRNTLYLVSIFPDLCLRLRTSKLMNKNLQKEVWRVYYPIADVNFIAVTKTLRWPQKVCMLLRSSRNQHHLDN